jgi:hypothetical protein
MRLECIAALRRAHGSNQDSYDAPIDLRPCLFAAAHFAAEVVSAQQVVIQGDPTCRACNIERQLIACEFGEAGDDFDQRPCRVAVVRDSRGRFYVNDQDDGPIKVFTLTESS